jgi:hypothetical protein
MPTQLSADKQKEEYENDAVKVIQGGGTVCSAVKAFGLGRKVLRFRLHVSFAATRVH